jgi:hypothetical protein
MFFLFLILLNLLRVEVATIILRLTRRAPQ